MKEAGTDDSPSPLARLDDYVRGQGDEQVARAFEEDLFERALEGKAPEAVFHAGLGRTLRSMNARGTLDLWLTLRDVERVRSSGLKAVLYEWNAEAREVPEVPPDADLLITRIPLPLEGVHSIEAEIFASDGRLLKRMPDVLFDPADGAVFACCEADLARTAVRSERTVTKVWVVTESGRQLLAELGI